MNLRVALRTLLRTPAFSVTAILTLALGIGLSTAVFTVANALLLRDLPIQDQDCVVALWGEKRDGSFPNVPLSEADGAAFDGSAGAFEHVASYVYNGALPTILREPDGGTSRIMRALVAGSFFDVLGARPLIGRALRESDDAAGAEPVIVLSHALWQRRFGGDPRALGQRLTLYANGMTYTVVGVMPRGFEFPRHSEAWATTKASTPAASMQYMAFNLVGRLAPRATIEDARRELTEFFARPGASPWHRDVQGVVTAFPRLVLGDVRPAVLAFGVACGLLLLITCINVANLLLVRGLARGREIAVRSALGASRSRVIKQLLTENGLLALAGGLAGFAVAAGAIQLLVAVAPPDLPRLEEIELSGMALLAATAITGIAMLLFALPPAVTTSRADLQTSLRTERQGGPRRSRLLSELLVAGQIGLAVVVLAAAGVVARSLVALERAELAFEPNRLFVAELAMSAEFSDAKKQRALLDRLVPRVEALRGVRGVSPVVAVPYASSGGWDGRPSLESQSAEEAAANPILNMEVIGPGYFNALGMPVLRGRAFTDADRDGAPAAIIVSQAAAEHFWPTGDPIGGRLRMGPGGPLMTVVGVVPETRYRELREARSSIYFPLAQSFFPFAPSNLVIRADPSPTFAMELRRVIQETDAGVTLATVAPFETHLARPLAQPRMNALLLALFAGAAVMLVAVGLFGVIATMVRQRTRELGVRMALGATVQMVHRLVVTRGLRIAAAGTLAGLLGALVANRFLASLLYEVTPTDPMTLAIVATTLIGVALAASLLAARGTTRIDPAVTLRADA